MLRNIVEAAFQKHGGPLGLDPLPNRWVGDIGAWFTSKAS